MKLIMTLLARDEEDILATNIEYHLARGVDFFIATDNLSTDRTREIFEHYRSRGLLHLILEDGKDHSQYKWVTRMARMACVEFGADWVINNDADEFWWPEGGTSLKEPLAAVPRSSVAVVVERSNFVPRPAPPGAYFAQTMTVRETRSLNVMGAPLPPKVCHRALGDVEVAQGNHSIRRAGIPVETVMAPISILHFPWRGYDQFARKITVGGAAVQGNVGRENDVETWRMIYEKFKRGELAQYYRQYELDDAAVGRGIADGRLVRDERLLQFLRSTGIVDSLRRNGP